MLLLLGGNMNLLKFNSFLLISIMLIGNIFARSQPTDTSHCPTEMIRAILESRVEAIQSLLEDGENPDISLSGCHIVVDEEGTVTLSDEIIFWTSLPEATLRSSSLIHLIARMIYANRGGDKDVADTIYSRQMEIYRAFVDYEVDTSVVDVTGKTPLDIAPFLVEALLEEVVEVAEVRVRE